MSKDKTQFILEIFGNILDKTCQDFAIKQMLSTDFILIRDAGGKITEDVKISRGNSKNSMYTIKNSCREKYIEFYNNKLQNIIDKFLKENA